jgi:hypothetical protein
MGAVDNCFAGYEPKLAEHKNNVFNSLRGRQELEICSEGVGARKYMEIGRRQDLKGKTLFSNQIEPIKENR